MTNWLPIGSYRQTTTGLTAQCWSIRHATLSPNMTTDAENPLSALMRPDDPFGRMLYRVATVLAVFGGLTLLVIVSINFVSILGRFLFSSPLLGDFELVE